MATHYPRKDSPYYWIRFQRADMTWGSKSSGIRIDEDGSLRKITQMVNDLTAKESLTLNDGDKSLLRAWVPAWLEYKYAGTGTLIRYKNAWAHLSIFLERKKAKHPAEVSYGMCHEYMRWRTDPNRLGKMGRSKVAWNTALLELRMLGAVLQEAVRRGLITANPCARLGIGRKNESEKREITREEETQIQAQLDAKEIATWMGEAFLIGMRQGCRLAECAVPMTDVRENAKHPTITFRVKGGGVHTAPLHKDLLPLVAKARAEGRTHLVTIPPNASTRFGQFFERKKYVGLCFHCTRVTVVTRLCRAGFSESQTMAYIGHASALVHAIYQKLRAPDVAHLGDALS